MPLDVTGFLAQWGQDIVTAGGAAAAAGFLAYRYGKQRRLPVSSQRASAAIAASGSVALVWPDQDDGTGWGAPEEEADSSTRMALLKRLDLVPADPTQEPSTFEILEALVAASPELGIRLSQLRQRGEAFTLSILGLEVMGKPHGAKAIVWVTPGASAGDLAGAGQASFPAWRTDSQGALLWANEAYLKAVEASDLEDGRARNSALDPKARDDAVLAAKGQPSTHTRAVTIDGKRRMLRIHLFPADDGASGIAFDVTEEIETRDTLAREARAHEETLNHLTDAVAVFDSARRLTTHNSAFSNLWGLEEAWLNDKPTHGEWLDRLRQSARISAMRDFAAWKAKELSHYQEPGLIPDETWTLPDGRILRVARQRQPSGGLLILFEDISDKMGLQARFKTLIEVQRATLDKLGEGVAVFTADGRLSLANSAFARMWGLDKGFLDALPEFDRVAEQAILVHRDPAFWSELKARISDPSPRARQEKQGEFVCADGTCLTWLTRPLPDGATLAAFADVTADREIEAALRDKAAAFQDADRLKTEFVRNVSYQLRTPLTTIGGYAELLAAGVGGSLTDAQIDYLGAISTASSQLEKLIENILDLAMIDAGQMSLDLGDVNLAETLDITAEMARTNSVNDQVRILVDCDDNAGIIRADKARIRQILFNLVSNAQRFTGKGDTITIGARRFDDTVRLWVSDTGPGIDMARQASAFEGFADGNRRAGVSLALVKRFVELHGGWVSLASPNAKGVTVSCYLPAAATQLHAAPELDLVD
ncbi:sensor protein DivL [Candidatus Phycosocius bacilliformis]|uniref:histidine kinase n=1 Tax=Candidatus Phycosocius bacilliformis TaxID=1445552 RepID=A0A2P2E6M0_9PROT|nr:PAS domain-containing sensor histidine kinase [Candidatus Phycosocius bacilliformis]GBF56721.1 sensor protein DivL [Candidatus Phycosocius bacilliformis]